MPATTLNWNTSGNTYVHAQLGDDFNGTGEANRPFRSLYRACVKGGTIIAAGIFSEMVPSVNDGINIYADSFGAAIFDGKRLTGLGGAVHNHANIAGDNSQGYDIYNKYIQNFIYLRSRVPVGYVGVGYVSNIYSYVGGGSLLVDSFTSTGNGNGHNCAFIYPKFNANRPGNWQDSNVQRMTAYHASYDYGYRQTYVGVRNNWSRTLKSTKYYCVYDDCQMPVIFSNNAALTFDHCAFRNTTFIIPASLSNDNTEHTITSQEIALAAEADSTKDCTQIITEWVNAHRIASTSYLPNLFSVCVMLKDTDPLFNNLNCVWRDATTGEVVDAAHSENAYIDPELSSFDISISDDSPAVPYLSGYGGNWRGAPATIYKMAQADTLTVDEEAAGDIKIEGNLKFETDTDGKPFITWAKDFDDPTLTDTFKGGSIITRPRKIPSAQLFKYPMISGQWAGAFVGESGRGSELMGRTIRLTGTTVQFDDDEPVVLDNDRLWLKNTPAANEVVAGYRYILKSGYVNLYNSSNMSYIEYTPGAVISTIAGDTYFLRRVYDGEVHPVETVELIELLPNNGVQYDYANRMEIRLFNSKADADNYNTDADLKEKGWIPIKVITDTLTGIHYYDLPQNDFVFSPTDGYLITQNPNINKTTQTLAVHAQHSDERHDAYMGDNMADYPQGVYTRTTNANRARYPFSPLNNTDIYVQLRMKIIPFTYKD